MGHYVHQLRVFSLLPLFQELRRAHVTTISRNERVGQRVPVDSVYTVSAATSIAPTILVRGINTGRKASISSHMPRSRAHSSMVTVFFSAVLVCGYAVLLRLS
jgi:hypothetical protein